MANDPPAAALITVQLIGEAVIALDSTVAREGLSKTDVVNRALQAYAFFTALQGAGGETYVRESPGADLHKLLLHQALKGDQ